VRATRWRAGCGRCCRCRQRGRAGSWSEATDGTAQLAETERSLAHDLGLRSRAINDGRWRPVPQDPAVEYEQFSRLHSGREVARDCDGTGAGWLTGKIGGGRGQRSAESRDQTRDRLMRGPTHGDAAVRPAQQIRQLSGAARQDERERSGPEGARQGVRRSIEREAVCLSLAAIAREEVKAFARGPSLQRRERRHVGLQYARAEAVDRLRRIREQATRVEMPDHAWNRRGDLRG